MNKPTKDFLDHLKLERNYSDMTIDSYRRDIEKILYMGYVTDDYRDLINVIHENENK